MLDEEKRSNSIVPLPALQARAQQERANPTLSYTFDPSSVVNSTTRATLSTFMDFMWERYSVQGQVDMRLSMLQPTLNTLLGPADASVITTPRALFFEIPGRHNDNTKFALRMTKATAACINFHCDGVYASGTVQVALNSPSEYKGGKLCFFVKDKLTFLERPIGSVCQHPPKVLHAVSPITEGVRKSLFVVDTTNGLGEAGVVDVTDTDITAFRDHKRTRERFCPRVQMCCFCQDFPSNHVLIPCGNLCVCTKLHRSHAYTLSHLFMQGGFEAQRVCVNTY
jgi:hypothetical protein